MYAYLKLNSISDKMCASVILEWKNLNLTIKKHEFKFSKCATQVEEKRILENGIVSIDEVYKRNSSKNRRSFIKRLRTSFLIK